MLMRMLKMDGAVEAIWETFMQKIVFMLGLGKMGRTSIGRENKRKTFQELGIKIKRYRQHSSMIRSI